MEAKDYAILIVKKLVKAGYIAYYAGGWPRDYVMGYPSDDIDIATNAPPEKILDLFPNTILVGLSFGVIVVVIEGHQFEVATFRRDIGYQGGRKPTTIELTDAEEDALRRDFTINGMFFDPLEDRIIDYTGGIEDINKHIIRAIGNPDERFLEDRLRMIRAVRFAARFEFKIEEETEVGIALNADTLFPAVAMERVWQEFNKMAAYPHFDKALIEMHRLRLLQVIFPTLESVHLNDIKNRVASFSYFPRSVEPILYILELFPNTSLEEQLNICRYLKISLREMDLVKYIFHLRKKINEVILRSKEEDLVEWSYLYAHPNFETCFKIIAASHPQEWRHTLQEKHTAQQEALKVHIERIVKKKPLINAMILQAHGILPGKKMGILLKEAEKIAINYNWHEVDMIMEKLKQFPVWFER